MPRSAVTYSLLHMLCLSFYTYLQLNSSIGPKLVVLQYGQLLW